MSTKPKFGRTELLDKNSLKALLHDDSQLIYRPLPDADIAAGSAMRPVWRVRFETLSNPARRFGLDINGEVKLGRGNDAPDIVDLTPYDAESLGVSRQHLMLRPTPTNLFVIDLGSMNGTLRNGRSIGIKTPYSLVDGDVLSLGTLQFSLQIVDRPHLGTAPLLQRADLNLADALSQIAKAITSQLDLDEVLNQVAATAMSLTSAAEAGIWLIDQRSGELFLEAERGMDDGWVQRKRIPLQQNTLVDKVVRTGQPVRTQHQPGKAPLKITTGYLVEALTYVPIMLGGVTFGVLTVVHREQGRKFDEQDEQLLTAVADFAAIAIQNARLFQATDKALEQRVHALSALNEVSRAVSVSLDLARVYEVLVEEVNKYCPVEAVQLFLRHRRQDKLTLLRQRDEVQRSAGYTFGQGIIGTVAQSNQMIVTNHATHHPRFDLQIDGLLGEDVASIAAIPLTSQSLVVGVLAMFNKKNGPFTDEDIGLLQSFTNPVAAAIENARLFEESERQRIAIQTTAETLGQPLLLLDDLGNLLVANKAATALLNTNMAQLFEAISAGVGRTTEVRIGEKTYLSTTEHLSDVGTIVVMQDITYVKQLEKDRSEFMHMLSHDLKNPLMAISGWTSLLERTVLLDEKSGRFVEEINLAARRMLNMINQLLHTVDREDAVQLTRQPVKVPQIIEEIIDDVRGTALHKEIKLSAHLSGKPYPVLADKTRFYHMVLNLVDNAIKYSPQQTQVEVLTYFADDDITIQVRDEGPGIPDEDLTRIFDKYFRSVHQDVAGGSGLGLAAVRTIATAHGGSVKAENRPERGALFTITLPGVLRLAENDAEDANGALNDAD